MADILLSLSEVAPDLQNNVSRLCERWWAKKGEKEAEDLVPHTLLYLVARTLADGATVSQLVEKRADQKYRKDSNHSNHPIIRTPPFFRKNVFQAFEHPLL